MTSTNASHPPVYLLLLVVTGLLFTTCGHLRAPRQGWNKRWGPLVPHKTFPADCGICHVSERWDVLRKDFSYDHAKETGHELKGAHADASCLRCHNDLGPVEAYTARGCAGCHSDPHRGQLTGDCEQCHNENNWRPQGLVAEHARTRFPLFGAHLAAACESCHVRAPTGDYRSAPTECATCHRDDLAQALSPDHAAQGWTASCERCHTPIQWGGAGFVHGFFPLTGGHAIDCSRCHAGNDFGPLPTDCLSCHQDDRARAPDHETFPVTCQNCHTIDTWKGARIDHSFFPLSGGHMIDCSRCHTNGRLERIPANCLSCHQDDRARAPDHYNFPVACEDCHTINTWEGATFRHDRFPIRGNHNLSCVSCHTTNNAPAFSCIDCHEHRRSEVDDEHDEVRNYRYESAACFQCHPNGEED